MVYREAWKAPLQANTEKQQIYLSTCELQWKAGLSLRFVSSYFEHVV